jgi:hypothetical protein
VWAGGLRLWCRPVSLRIFEKIRSQANRGRRRRNFEAECYATAVPALPCAISPYFISDGAFARALPGGLRSSPTRPNQEQLSHFARAVAFEPQLPYSPPVLIHVVAPLGTHLLDVEVTACRQGAQRDRRKSIRTPRGRRLAAAGAVAETPRRNDGVLRRARLRNWKRYAGPMWRPLERRRSGWDGEFESPLLQRPVCLSSEP